MRVRALARTRERGVLFWNARRKRMMEELRAKTSRDLRKLRFAEFFFLLSSFFIFFKRYSCFNVQTGTKVRRFYSSHTMSFIFLPISRRRLALSLPLLATARRFSITCARSLTRLVLALLHQNPPRPPRPHSQSARRKHLFGPQR